MQELQEKIRNLLAGDVSSSEVGDSGHQFLDRANLMAFKLTSAEI